MIKILMCSILLFCVEAIYSQVGINTSNPKGLLHIDAGVSGNGTDDVVITQLGYVGVGTDTPSTQLDIRTTSPVKAIRIADGSQSKAKVLMSNQQGQASWQYVSGGWSATLLDGNLPFSATLSSIPIIFSSAAITQNGEGAVSPSTGTITVPYAGVYRIQAYGICDTNRVTDRSYVAYFDIQYNGASAYLPHLVGHTSLGPTFVGFSNIMVLSANSTLTLNNNQSHITYANSVSNITFTVDFLR
uniref:hypothetical protein n=1 Tax=uncultured Dysgonomonas sp. TaxID=206096 RepID=UPI00260206BF|nr:hypothetical protein [uncultured Dysgonomonas sp.]